MAMLGLPDGVLTQTARVHRAACRGADIVVADLADLLARP